MTDKETPPDRESVALAREFTEVYATVLSGLQEAAPFADSKAAQEHIAATVALALLRLSRY